MLQPCSGRISFSWCKQTLQVGRGACHEASGVTRSFLGFFGALTEFSAYLCGHEESNIAAAPATGNSCHSTFLSDSGLNFFLFGTAHQLSLNPGEPPTGLENKKSACLGSREIIPRATHTLHTASEYLCSSNKRQQPKCLRTM